MFCSLATGLQARQRMEQKKFLEDMVPEEDVGGLEAPDSSDDLRCCPSKSKDYFKEIMMKFLKRITTSKGGKNRRRNKESNKLKKRTLE